VQRHLLERVFEAPVYDHYGCCELPWIAAQCERKGGLHVNAERVGVEFVAENNYAVQQGEWGSALITRYDDFVFPLIRYQLGDTGRFLKETCSCGRTLPLIDQVKGRTTDMIRLPSGRILSGDYLTTIFDAYPDAVQGFRVIQRKDDSILVEYVPGLGPNQENQRNIQRAEMALKDKVKQEVPLVFQPVSEIAHDRGKLRFVISEKQKK
jgi:phenylacetate-CoA ligase